MDNCKHMVTQGRDGQRGSWCIQCGVKVLEVETRVCDGCIHFRLPKSPIAGVKVPPYCTKRMMTIISGLHVTYKVAEGTCFEGKLPEYENIGVDFGIKPDVSVEVRWENGKIVGYSELPTEDEP